MQTYIALCALACVASVCVAERSCEDLKAKMDEKLCAGAGKDTPKCNKLAFFACKKNCAGVEGN